VLSTDCRGAFFAFAHDGDSTCTTWTEYDPSADVIGRDKHAAIVWSLQHPDGYLVRNCDASHARATYSQRGSWISIEAVHP